jgi:hypothetical protein
VVAEFAWPAWTVRFQAGCVVSLKPPTEPTTTATTFSSLSSRLDTVETDKDALLARFPTGTGSPESVVAAAPGSLYRQTNGSEGETLWIKETGSSTTGWRLVRRRFPVTLDLVGADPRASAALLGTTTASYGFTGDALSASMTTLVPEVTITPRLIFARWSLVWTPNASGCGVQLVHADSGPTNITQVAEFTGNAAVTPVASAVNVTSTLAPIIAAGARKFIGQQVKGNGSVGAVIFASRVEMILEG